MKAISPQSPEPPSTRKISARAMRPGEFGPRWYSPGGAFGKPGISLLAFSRCVRQGISGSLDAGARAAKHRLLGCGTSRVCPVPDKDASGIFELRIRSASSDRQLCYPPHTWNLTTRQVPIEIAEILLQFRNRRALRQIVRVLFEVANPRLAFLPMNKPSGAHGTILPPREWRVLRRI